MLNERIATVIPKLSCPQSLVATLLAVTQTSTHSYESGVHRLLLDVMDLRKRQIIDEITYLTVISTAIDVLYSFNYDHELLMKEANVWYRASIIHQMGQGMLQSLAEGRPELSARAFFRDAQSALTLGRHIPHPLKTRVNAAPLHCKQWA